MEQEEKIELYSQLVKMYGFGHQMDVAVEEMSELTNALMKSKRRRASKEEVVTEIADVVICMEQLGLHYGVKAVLDEKERKLQRLKERVERAAKLGGGVDTGDEGTRAANDGGGVDTCASMEDEGSVESEEIERPSTAASETDV